MLALLGMLHFSMTLPCCHVCAEEVEADALFGWHSFGVVICDESHALKAHKTKRTKHIWPMVQKAKRAILISGTPAPSRPIELFTQVTFLRHELMPAMQLL